MTILYEELHIKKPTLIQALELSNSVTLEETCTKWGGRGPLRLLYDRVSRQEFIRDHEPENE